jgi:adenine phosphoribosyltransferase
MNLDDYIRDIPDFPKPGILFKDITPLLADGPAFRESIKQMADPFRDSSVDVIVGAEARGFIFGAPLAVELECGFVPIRKPGKLPFSTRAFEYELEYGTDQLEMHIDGVGDGQNVLVVDDLLATGGTVEACVKLLEGTGANVVACVFLIQLLALGGAAKIEPHKIVSLLKY